MSSLIPWLVVIVLIVAAIVVVLAWFSERASREVSLVKTGFGGRRVVMDGGIIAIPWFHDIARVNMRTLRLEVRRAGADALMTRDRLRIDVGVAFYVSVIADEDGVARASQTLGSRTFQAEALRDLLEGKLIDALLSIAARFNLDELHENRGGFVEAVRDNLAETLAGNGLALESVSLTGFDQTPFAALDENNAFDAEGMRKLAELIARAKQERAEIDAESQIAVRQAAMEARKRQLRIDLEERQAEIAQAQEIETLKAAQLAEVARRKADGEREAARARIAMEQEIEAANIDRERALRIAQQEREIAIAAKAEDESRAQIAADQARAAVETARQLAAAERELAVALVRAEQQGQTAAVLERLAAEAARASAEDRATTRLTAAEAERQALAAEAEGRRAVIEVENAIAGRIAAMKVELARLESLPKIVAELVKPAEKIDKIRLHHVTGLGGAGDRLAIVQALDSLIEAALALPASNAIAAIAEDIAAERDDDETAS